MRHERHDKSRDRATADSYSSAIMISVVIPTFNSEACLPHALAALVPAAVEGVVREVIVVDGGSTDGTYQVAEASGARFLRSRKGRGAQLAAGAAMARGDWLLFLHADTVLQSGWIEEVTSFLGRAAQDARAAQAAAFRFALDDVGIRPRVLEVLVYLRCALLCAPYGDQGLLVSRAAYEQAGGFRDMLLMEDIDLVRRLGCRRLQMLKSRALTSAARYRRDGYLLRSARNLACLALYYMRVPPRYLVRLYDGGKPERAREKARKG